MAKPNPEPAVESGAREDAWREREGERLLVVGIGASAGGLEAFERLLGRVPPDSGLAYVLVQHLDPEHESILAEILGRATGLPVEIAKDAQRIERDHVYVIPRRAGLLVEGGALRVVAAEPGGNRLLLNAFFTSLAEDQGENAVGVVLSGTGSDGALGIAAVKKHGGKTFAQLPSDARYASMPAAAIATGLVDQVLPVEENPRGARGAGCGAAAPPSGEHAGRRGRSSAGVRRGRPGDRARLQPLQAEHGPPPLPPADGGDRHGDGPGLRPPPRSGRRRDPAAVRGPDHQRHELLS